MRLLNRKAVYCKCPVREIQGLELRVFVISALITKTRVLRALGELQILTLLFVELSRYNTQKTKSDNFCGLP